MSSEFMLMVYYNQLVLIVWKHINIYYSMVDQWGFLWYISQFSWTHH